MSRIICWFSCGAASAVAAKLALKKYKNVEIVRIIVRDEDEDNQRFADDCEKWFGVKIINIINEKYDGSVDKVIESRKYMGGVAGSPCTKFLKKEVRIKYQREDDQHVFGFHLGEEHRVGNLIDNESDIDVLTPLIDEQLTKDDCLSIIEKSGIQLPKMYRLGYPNANCRGCVKAVSASYWNKTRIDFPETFKIRSEQEKLTGARLWKMSANKYKSLFPEMWKEMNENEPECFMIDKSGTLRAPLRYLPTGYAELEPERLPDCGIMCQIVSSKIN